MPNYKLSIDVCLNKIFSVFQEIMMSQLSDRAIFALVGSYAAYIDSYERFGTTLTVPPWETDKLSQNVHSQLPIYSA